jgi:predicted nucleic acid-binding protein
MSDDRYLLDTVFIQALLNKRDQYHDRAVTFLPRVREAAEVWITEAVLLEVGNALSAFNRSGAAGFIRQCYRTPNMRVVTVDTALLFRAIELYSSRPDKAWGLIDCISFIVMEDQALQTAVTVDQHFKQAGYQTILEDMD